MIFVGDTSEDVIVMVRVTVVWMCPLGNNGNLRLLSALLTLLTQQSIHLLSYSLPQLLMDTTHLLKVEQHCYHDSLRVVP